MEHPVSELNIAATALLAQFLILIILTLGAAIASRDKEEGYYGFRVIPTILLLALATLGILLFSTEISTFWRPLVANPTIPTLSTSWAVPAVFMLNIFSVSKLVARTGGGMLSSFVPVYFMIPALAIFLRSPRVLVVVYLALVIILFSINVFRSARQVTISVHSRFAFLVISIACFALTTLIGIIVQPN